MVVSLTRCCVICFVLAITGCSSRPASVDVETNLDVPATDILRQNLKPASETGQLGSEKISIEEGIEMLAKQEPDKAAELSKDLKELAGLSGAAAKAKANAMIGKL